MSKNNLLVFFNFHSGFIKRYLKRAFFSVSFHLTVTDRCCNSCDDVREAYRRRGWALKTPDTIEQCKREGFTQKMQEQKNEGCQVYGVLEVNKVSGDALLPTPDWTSSPDKTSRYENTSTNSCRIRSKKWKKEFLGKRQFCERQHFFLVFSG